MLLNLISVLLQYRCVLMPAISKLWKKWSKFVNSFGLDCRGNSLSQCVDRICLVWSPYLVLSLYPLALYWLALVQWVSEWRCWWSSPGNWIESHSDVSCGLEMQLAWLMVWWTQDVIALNIILLWLQVFGSFSSSVYDTYWYSLYQQLFCVVLNLGKSSVKVF